MSNEKHYQQAFNAMVKNDSEYEKFESMKLVIESAVNDAKGEESAESYEILRKLSNSINNAGWEERHSEIISMIENQMVRISTMYEDYLP